MCLEFNCVEQNNIYVRTIVHHYPKKVAMKLHRPLREVVSVPKEFQGYSLGTMIGNVVCRGKP